MCALLQQRLCVSCVENQHGSVASQPREILRFQLVYGHAIFCFRVPRRDIAFGA
jgi:hypothetical protein